ncbi:MAG: undecaprenyldiphospho-muramoylpentapeptide beta-N-acetylglucosaminyltransferase [Xanthomonadales bacterium]|nr:undecaprenyldiphospho-muramoylpentapeptide beta-N-acetylglucosaminyltransferase [Xanthomonadales bacterium]
MTSNSSSKAAQAVLIMAGGTGGHIFPGLAVAEALENNGTPVRWLGARGAMECERVPPRAIPLDTVDISGLRGKGALGWVKAPFRLMRAVLQASSVIGHHRPRCAISFGGYAAGPGGLAAWLRGVPLLVHEQNRVPGLTNKVLARMARKVLQAFPGTWPSSEKAETCGNPVRREVVALAEPQARFVGRQGRPRLLITGGSQGARALNTNVPGALALLPVGERPLVRHQAGRREAEHTAQAYRAQGIEAEVGEFIDDMAEAYAWADLVVCRSGALTVSELAAAGLGAVLVPFPHAVDDHQTRNAEFLAEAGAAEILPETELTPESLADVLRRLLGDRAGRLRMAQAARSVAVPDSAQRVAGLCLEVAG